MTLWGPLGQLAGEWEGSGGLDVSFHHDVGEVAETAYREHITFKPFGPVDNGTQHLYGLDYRMAAWREGEENPFHTELGYWLWCGGLGQVMRAFLVPRGSMVLAGGDATADATSFTMAAEVGSETYGVLSNPYLAGNARVVGYECSVDVAGDQLTYVEDTLLEMKGRPEVLHHTDRNVLTRIEAFDLPDS